MKGWFFLVGGLCFLAKAATEVVEYRRTKERGRLALSAVSLAAAALMLATAVISFSR